MLCWRWYKGWSYLYIQGFYGVAANSVCPFLSGTYLFLYGSISQFPSVIGLLLTGFIADRLGVENIFIIGGIAISITGILLLCSASVRNLERKDSSTFWGLVDKENSKLIMSEIESRSCRKIVLKWKSWFRSRFLSLILPYFVVIDKLYNHFLDMKITYNSTNYYLIPCNDGFLLIDAGWNGLLRVFLEKLHSIGIAPVQIKYSF